VEVLGIVEGRLCYPSPGLIDKPFAAVDDDPRNAVRKIKCRFELRCNHDRAGTVDAPLARDPFNRTKRTVHTMGKTAITHYEVVERFPGVTLLRCKLETGRTHQIRVHMQHIGHPLVGETVYSASRRSHLKIPFPRQALHAERLGLNHPITHQNVQWEAPLPEDFATLLQALRTNTAWDR